MKQHYKKTSVQMPYNRQITCVVNPLFFGSRSAKQKKKEQNKRQNLRKKS